MKSLFQERLKELRLNKNRTQKELSEYLEVGMSTYGAYERGKIMPPMEKINRLAEFFDVSTDYLIGNTNDRKREFITYNRTDISVSIENLLNHLKNDITVIVDGRELDGETRQLLYDSLSNNLKMVKSLIKKEGG